MKNIKLRAPAKLNLSLNLLPRRGARGFFQVRFINVQAELHDLVTLSRSPGGSGVTLNGEQAPGDDLACRAAALVADSYGIRERIHIGLEKRIPVRAGLGGGSADAAAVINGMDALFSLGITERERVGLAGRLGMDVCYCVVGGLCAVGGIGDRVKRLSPSPPPLDLLIATPRVHKPSTAWAYRTVDPARIGMELEKIDELLAGIKHGDAKRIATSLHNDFEPSVGAYFPLVRRLKGGMLDRGALGALLAGSGLSVFGVFPGSEAMGEACSWLEELCIPWHATRVAAGPVTAAC
ncbi:MAG: 4-(cytidine 5'-diphospho)-2-C-methyl-D-erythritol kinase [Spirochaetota bacterium]